MQIEKKIIINPADHEQAVSHFIKYHNIKSKSPELSYLEELLIHYAGLPYENISKIVKLHHDFSSPERIRLPEEIMDDYERYHLGGTCFSLTFFLQSLLTIQGFHCYPVIASMQNRPNAHCALIVSLNEKKYLIDPGYLLTKPMELHKNHPRVYRTPHSGVELIFNKNNEHFFLRTFDRHQSKWRYFFRDDPVPPDLFLSFWYDSFYKSTMHDICLTKIRNDGLVYMHKDLLQITNFDGKQKEKIKHNYHAIVHNIFGIDPQLVEQALVAIHENIRRQKQLGLFRKNERTILSDTD
ncbi:arylamine N-acetyltransferase [candidate division KSB1 bacterium]|nr:arylamine N-acetyltransferase [candidate division KSB1 bacterium]